MKRFINLNKQFGPLNFHTFASVNKVIMATPIKITPILQGKDSEQFNKSLSKNKDLKVSSEKKRKMQDLVTKVLSNKK